MGLRSTSSVKGAQRGHTRICSEQDTETGALTGRTACTTNEVGRHQNGHLLRRSTRPPFIVAPSGHQLRRSPFEWPPPLANQGEVAREAWGRGRTGRHAVMPHCLVVSELVRARR